MIPYKYKIYKNNSYRENGYKDNCFKVTNYIPTSLVYRIDDTILVYRIDDTIRIVDTLIRYTICIVILIVSFIQ